MKKNRLLLLFIIAAVNQCLFSQQSEGTEIYLITCAPGSEIYSIYGHSALHIVNHDDNTDYVFNWGVFDFSTPHFAWKFAKGRLEYMLGVYPYERFLQEYFFEKRSVFQQKINLDQSEIETLLSLIRENLKPENIKYRYDFFYDNCSTRIRDLLERSTGEKLIYPPETDRDIPTFREKVNYYQRQFPWLQFGVDLLLGRPADKKSYLRDRMFLPIDMQEGLSDAVINRTGKLVPLLQNPESLLDFDLPQVKRNAVTAPISVFSVILIIVITLSASVRNIKINKVIDLTIFTILSLLALLLIFFNFFSDHDQTKWNLNMLWISPLIIICLISLIFNREWYGWFRAVFFLSLFSFIIQVIFPAAFNNAFIPLELLIAVRSSMRSGFRWNPLSIILTEV